MISFITAKSQDAKQIQDMANAIWRQHYTPIIGAKQVAYMLSEFQSETAIKQQMLANYDYYLVCKNAKPIGYLTLIKQQKSLFISKFYLSEVFRGQGIAYKMLTFVTKKAQLSKLQQLELTVNKQNPAYYVYLKLGFNMIDEIKIDIGEGFIMDDYRLIKQL